ncbi:MAG: PilZ domain-containing protein [Omnitrophica bacterium]|nr:PilZ domain-containing protein [Candidatus Omnitrophota bacterium]
MQANPVEKRRHPRLDSRIPMRYRKIEAGSQEFKGSLMRDISEGGTRMTIHEFLPMNSRLAMEIPLLSGRRPLGGVCRVAWVKKTAFSEQYDTGLEFINLNQGNILEIAKYILKGSAEEIA